MKRNLKYFIPKSDNYIENKETLESMKSKGFKVIYQYDYMIIIEGNNRGFMVWNLNLKYKCKNYKGHAHINNFNIAKKMCERIVRHELPRNLKSEWLIKSYIRCSDSDNYKSDLIDLYERKKQKGCLYFNSNKGIR